MQSLKKSYKQPNRIWVCSEHTHEENKIIEQISESLGIRSITAGLVYDRTGKAGLEAANRFIREGADYHDPFLMKDMSLVCDRILEAIEKHEKVTVYGDYDVDGVTSVSMLLMYLRSRGLEDCTYYIPCRIGEGYGLSRTAIEKVYDSGSTLIITVDTGITAVEEIEYAKKLGIDTVVTDHHECSRSTDSRMILPDAPCVDPKRDDCEYPFKELAGVGVAFKLICALEMRLSQTGIERTSKILADKYGELVAIGTVADVMPLVDENRTIVKTGLANMNSPRFVGTRELISVCAGVDYGADNVKKLTASLISFTLAPRINAVGRMSNASEAVELFISESSADAADRAAMLCSMNTLRQQEENKILDEALEKMSQAESCDRVIVLDSDTWHHGVVGIVASRISERYALPCILISFEGNTGNEPGESDIGKGSGRSIKGLDLVKALDASRDTLVKFGGHELAAGLSVERGRLDEFKKKINEYAKSVISDARPEQRLEADAKIKIEELDRRQIEELYLLEPYGQLNPAPKFILESLEIDEIYPLKEGKHVKLSLSDGKHSVTALWFGMNYADLEFGIGDIIDVYATAELNEFMGKVSVQLHIKDAKLSKESEEKLALEESAYRSALHGGEISYDMIPDREDFAAVYRYLRSNVNEDGIYNYNVICAHARAKQKLEYIKLRVVLDIMCELSLISYFAIDEKLCRIELNGRTGKVDLESSELFITLKRRANK